MWLLCYSKKFNARIKEIFSCIQKRPFPAYNGFIVGCWSSIVQTSQFENRKNLETKDKIQALSFPTINYIYWLLPYNPESNVAFSAFVVICHLSGLLCGVQFNKEAKFPVPRHN